MLRTAPSDDVAGVLLAAAALGPALVVVAVGRSGAARGDPAAACRAHGRRRARRVGARRGRRRRRGRRPGRGVGAVPGPRRGRRPRRARRGAAGGAQPDVARPRRGGRAAPAGRRAGAARLAVPERDAGWRPSATVCVRPPIDEERAGLADRRGRRPQPRRAVEDVARHLGADPAPPRPRADRRVRAQHTGPWRACSPAAAAASLVRCARCEAAVGLADDGTLACRRCGEARPAVCLACGASAFANLRPGVTRLREELEAAAGRPVVAVTGGDDEPPPDAGVYVGTEAVLHRVQARRRRRLPRHRHRAAGAALPRRRAGDGAARPRRPARRAPRPRRAPAAADVPAAPRGRPGGAARRPGQARRARARPAARCSACRRSGRWLPSAVAAPTRSPPRSATPPGITVGGDAGSWTRPRRHVGRARPGAGRSAAAEGLRVRIEVDPHAADDPPGSGVSSSRRANVEEAVALGGCEAGRRPALLGRASGAGSRRRGACGRRGRPGRPAPAGRASGRADRAAPACRCGSAGSTRSRRTARRRARRPARRPSRCRSRWRPRSPRTARVPAR